MKSVAKMALVAVGFILVCGLAAIFRLHRVHDQTGEWRLHPDAAPAILRIDGHLYDRTGRADGRLPGLQLTKDTDMGGGLLVMPTDAPQPVSQFQVRFRDRYYDYRLAG